MQIGKSESLQMQGQAFDSHERCLPRRQGLHIRRRNLRVADS